MAIPKYIALCTDDDTVGFCGEGDTVDEAFDEFMSNGEFDDQCAYWIAAPGDGVEVHIYSTMNIEDSDWPKEEIKPHWEWCLNEKIETRIAPAT